MNHDKGTAVSKAKEAIHAKQGNTEYDIVVKVLHGVL